MKTLPAIALSSFLGIALEQKFAPVEKVLRTFFKHSSCSHQNTRIIARAVAAFAPAVIFYIVRRILPSTSPVRPARRPPSLSSVPITLGSNIPYFENELVEHFDLLSKQCSSYGQVVYYNPSTKKPWVSIKFSTISNQLEVYAHQNGDHNDRILSACGNAAQERPFLFSVEPLQSIDDYEKDNNEAWSSGFAKPYLLLEVENLGNLREGSYHVQNVLDFFDKSNSYNPNLNQYDDADKITLSNEQRKENLVFRFASAENEAIRSYQTYNRQSKTMSEKILIDSTETLPAYRTACEEADEIITVALWNQDHMTQGERISHALEQLLVTTFSVVYLIKANKPIFRFHYEKGALIYEYATAKDLENIRDYIGDEPCTPNTCKRSLAALLADDSRKDVIVEYEERRRAHKVHRVHVGETPEST